MDNVKNDPKLAGLTPEMKAKAVAVLAELHKLSYDVHVAEGKRTWEQQKKKVADGVSKTMHSKHLTGQAVDVVDRRWGWNPPSRLFWLRLGASCVKAGLGWGGFFGLSSAEKAKLRKALVAGHFDAATSMRMGWDPAHCEIAG